jgi:nucleotide-binding universal stress UspA family protein
MSQIVVGYDGSGCAQAALDAAIAFAKELDDGIVIVFGFAPGGYGGGEVPTQREAVKELGEQVTGEAAAKTAAAGVDHAVEMLNEHGADALNDIAERHDARMIVVGTHGESPLRGAIMGSTAHRLIEIANHPVLVVRQPGD